MSRRLLILFILTPLFLSGCASVNKLFKNLKADLTDVATETRDQVQDIKTNLTEQTKNLRSQINSTQQNIEDLTKRVQETKAAIEGSVNKINEAVDSIQKVKKTMDGETPASTPNP